MANTSVSEPTVSVHGVPQSQYNPAVSGGGSPASPAQGLGARFQQHPILWSVGIGVAILIIYVIYKNNQNANATGVSSTTGTGSPSSPDQMWGSQLDADYQQVISTQNTSNGLLQQILNQLQNPSNNPPSTWYPPPGPPTPTPQPTPTGNKSGNPLYALGLVPGQWQLGKVITINGQTWTEDPGGGGRLWGIPGDVPISKINSTPIGTGQKQLLQAPASYYH